MPARSALLAFCITVLATNALAQSRVRGVVRDSNGAPIPMAVVRLQGHEVKEPQTTTADENGGFEFPSVTPGIRVQIVALRDLREVAHAYALVTLPVETIDLRVTIEAYPATSLAAVIADSGRGGELAGVVMADGDPLAGARMSLGDSPMTTTTDDAGRYVFAGLRAGITVTVHAAADGYHVADKDVTIVDGQRTASDFALTAAQRSVDAPAPASADPASLATALDPLAESRQLFRALSFLPSLEGGHAPAAMSVEAPDQASAARPLRTLSGVFDVNTTGAGGSVNIPLGPQASATVFARRSLSADAYAPALNWFGPTVGVPVRDRVARYSGGPFPDAPLDSSFTDANASLSWTPTKSDLVSLRVFDWKSDLNNSHDLSVPAETTNFHAVKDAPLPDDAVVQVSDVASGTSSGFGLLWRHAWDAAQRTSLSIDQFTSHRGGSQAWLLESPASGDYSFVDARGGSQGLTESNRVKKTTVDVQHTLALGFAHAVSIDGRVSTIDAAYDLQTETMTPAAGTIGSTLVDLVRRDDTTTTLTVDVQDEWRPLGRLTVTPGVRMLHDQLTASSFVEPRVSASYQLLPLLKIRGRWSVDHDVAPYIAREDLLHGDGSLQALANGSTIPVARTRTGRAGATFDLPGGFVDAAVFRLSLDGLTILAPRMYPGVGPSEALFYQGTGEAQGVEFRFHQVVERNTLTLGYTLSHATNTIPALEAATFDASNDRRHQFSIVESVLVMPRWTASISWTAASGQPYTVASGLQQVWFPNGVGVDQVTFGAKNAARLPAYHHLDASTKYDIRYGAVVTSVGVNVFNLYDHQNVLFEEYDTAGQVVTPHDVTAMGRATDVFVRIRF